MITEDIKKPKQKCWECEWAGGKDDKCPWASKFEPVPGWTATPTKININTYVQTYTDSYEIHDCPLFELMTEIKQRIFDNAGVVRGRGKPYPDETVKEVLRLWLDEERKASEIADITGLNEQQIYRITRKVKERKWNGKEI